MKYPKTLYVRMEQTEDDTYCYDAHPDAGMVRESEPDVQVLGVYQLVGTVETKSLLQISPVKKQA